MTRHHTSQNTATVTVERAGEDDPTAPDPPELVPTPVHVLLLRQWFRTLAYDRRVTPRGPETLLAVTGGRMTWVPSQRVVPDPDDTTEPPSEQGLSRPG